MKEIISTIFEVALICIPLFFAVMFLFRNADTYHDKYDLSKFKQNGISFAGYRRFWRVIGFILFLISLALFWYINIYEPEPMDMESREFLENINKDSKSDVFGMAFALFAAIAIPARMGSTRFPGKPLATLGGKKVIERVWESCKKSQYADKVAILTDSPEIRDFAKTIGADCIMTSPKCASGTERIVEAIGELDASFIVNVQGDEPFISPKLIDAIIERRRDTNAEIVTAASKIENAEQLANPNVVKVLRNELGNAIYFSRTPLPYNRDLKDKTLWLDKCDYWRHIGIYGYSAKAIALYSELPVSKMEKCEMLEQLRFVAAGKVWDIVETEYNSIGIDTAADLRLAEEFLKSGR